MIKTLRALKEILNNGSVDGILLTDLMTILDNKNTVDYRIRGLYSMGYDENTRLAIMSSTDPAIYMHQRIIELCGQRILVIEEEVDLNIVPEIL